MNVSITICLKSVNVVLISKTLRPVTVVVEVAVNKATVDVVGCIVAIGNLNSKVLMKIRRRKLPAMTIGGDNGRLAVF